MSVIFSPRKAKHSAWQVRVAALFWLLVSAFSAAMTVHSLYVANHHDDIGEHAWVLFGFTLFPAVFLIAGMIGVKFLVWADHWHVRYGTKNDPT